MDGGVCRLGRLVAHLLTNYDDERGNIVPMYHSK